MKLIPHLAAAALLLLPLAARSAPSVLPELLAIQPDHVFAPPGFDDNDTNAQIVLAGEYPNNCFKAAQPEYQIDAEAKRIVVRNRAYVRESCWCLPMMVPYMHALNLGPLPAGEYQVLTEDALGKLKEQTILPIAAGKRPGPDDTLYALVQDAKLEPAAASGTKTLTLTGLLTSSCMTLGTIQVIHRKPGVVEILPMATLDTDAGCVPVHKPFEARVTLAPGRKGTALVHVRSLNGQAINKVAHFN